MNPRQAVFLTVLAASIAGCDFTLAADVTPPPNYVPPTPMPTLGPLFPAAAPDIENGAAIYAEKCAPCHGATGFGDGEQGKQLPVTVAAFALPEAARKASPAAWFKIVSQGNLDRFMPPFNSLSEAERWDVVAYALTLHTTPAQIEQGRALFDANCADCGGRFRDLETMASLTGNDLIRIVRNGDGDLPAIGSGLSDEETEAIAAYIRTLTFAAPPPPAASSAEAGGTTAAQATPAEAAPQAAAPGLGTIHGTVDDRTPGELPSDLTVTLREFDHGDDPSAGPREVASTSTGLNPDGSFRFTDVNFTENRIYLAEIEWEGITYRSEFVVIEAGMTDSTLAPITVYPTTEDFSILRIDALQMYFDFANDGSVQVLAVYTITNPADETVVLTLDDQQAIPFIHMPAGAQGVGYEASPDSAPFVPLGDGFAMPPSETPYGLIAFATLPKTRQIEVDQAAVLPVAQVTLLVPEGVTAEGKSLSNMGLQEIQGGRFIVYSSAGIDAGASLSFTLAGEPRDFAIAPDITQNRSLVIGAGVLGLALILAGAWLYWRERPRSPEQDSDEAGFDDPDSVLDAIIALDDLHRAGKLSDESHRRRRDELKGALKRKSPAAGR
jgi:mono/diheme cytochrome c family protein